MSVTITINNNREFCDAHGLYRDVHEPAEFGYPEMNYREYQFQLNLANGNWGKLCRAFFPELCANEDLFWCGSMPAAYFFARLDQAEVSDLVTHDAESGGKGTGKCRIIECGISPDQAESYIERLLPIVSEALRRGEEVVWS